MRRRTRRPPGRLGHARQRGGRYRALALLALPFAQKLTPRVDALSEELMSLTEAMRSGGASG